MERQKREDEKECRQIVSVPLSGLGNEITSLQSPGQNTLLLRPHNA